MSSDRAETARERIVAPLLRAALRVLLKPTLSPHLPIVAQRWWLHQLARLNRPARGVAIEPASVGGIAGEWLRPQLSNCVGTILYLHGGGFCTGSAATHRALTSRLARAAGLPVFAADYRLAPEHPFPAAVEDAVSACRALAGAPFVVAGDSAGAWLALAAALATRERAIRPPTALVLFSPWIDLAAVPDTPRDVMTGAAWLRACARHFGASDRASPLHADLRGLPPTLIQAGGAELLRRDAERLQEALEQAGIAVRCEIVSERWHAFQLHAGMLPSADAAVARAARFARDCL
jgi:acetyl esterase/lipase